MMKNKLLITLCLFAIGIASFGQSMKVTGIVTDAKDKEVLPGVNIVIKGTAIGVATDMDGKYSITIPSEKSILVFSFLGYRSKEVIVTGSNINITLDSDVKDIDQVVVVGYGVQKKADITGAVSSVKSEDLNNYDASSPEQLLQGKLTGVRIISNNGEPGAGVNISVRGIGSITTGMQPLYVIDGIPLDGRSTSPDGVTSAPATSPLNFINANDIESIDVLKDASAAAIYGSRGAGGVILITTKKGKEGQSEINYSTNFSLSQLPHKLNVLTADEWRAYRLNPENGLKLNGTDPSDYGASTDWQDQIFRTAFSQTHNLSLSGGNSKTSYRASVGYANQAGIIKQSDLKKYVGRLNLSQKGLNDRLLVEMNFTLSEVDENRVPVGSTGSEGDLLVNALTANPTIPVLDSLGQPIQTIASERFPTTLLAYYDDKTRTSNLLGGISASLEILKNLTFKTNIGLSYSNARRLINQNEKLIYLSNGATNSAQNNEVELYNYLVEYTLNYDFNKGPHKLNFLAGYSFQDFHRYSTNMYAGGFSTNAIIYTDNFGNASSQLIYSSTDSYQMQSFFGRINYSLFDKYLFTGTYRRDGSNKFGKNNRYGDFPSFSFAWRLADEGFIKDLQIFSNLKFRTGWGLTGNSNIPSGLTRATFRPAPENLALIGNNASPVPGFTLARTSNSMLQWESTETYNIGLDFSLFKGRISGVIDIYNKTSNNLLLEVPSPPGSPTATVYTNLDSTKIINKGLELSLSGLPVRNEVFTWEISGNISFIKNMVNQLPVKQYVTGRAQGPGVQGVYAEVIASNMSIGEFQGNRVDSIGSNGKIYYLRTSNGKKDSTVFLGSALPKFTWSITNSFQYKNFDLNFFIDGVYGNKIFNNTALIADKTNIKTAKNTLTYFADDNTSISQPSMKVSDRYIEDGSYIRLNTVSLGYTFDLKDKKWVKNLKVYLSGSNLLLLTKYKGYDPDVNSDRANGSVRSHGIDLTSYPKARIYSVGLNVTF